MLLVIINCSDKNHTSVLIFDHNHINEIKITAISVAISTNLEQKLQLFLRPDWHSPYVDDDRRLMLPF